MLQHTLIDSDNTENKKPTSPVYYLEIAVNRPLFQNFTYYSPTPVEVGSRVLIKIGKSSEVGIVTSTQTQIPDANFKIKAIDKLLDPVPTFSRDTLTLLEWAAGYYLQPLGEILFTFLPKYLKREESLTSLYSDVYSSIDRAEQTALPKNAHKQIEALEFITTHSPISKEILRKHGIQSQTLKQLLDKQLIVKHSTAPKAKHTSTESPTFLTLNEEQKHATQAVIQSEDSFNCFLLEGITGSGKTEVYLNISQHFLSQGKQVLLLVPEIGLTPQLADRLQSQLPFPVITLHSDLANKERASRWLQSHDSDPVVLIGTRSAVACNLPNLGCIILDEEHDSSFKQQEGTRYHSRSLAIKRAQLAEIPIVLGSATPSIETLINTQEGKYKHLTLTMRATGATLPDIHLEDTNLLAPDKVFPEKTIASITETLSNQQQALVFINRRGYAPTMQCSQCHWIAECSDCDVAMTVHRSTNSLNCHHCESTSAIPQRCPKCNSPYLTALGFGTERIESELTALFPNHPILRMDRDSTQNRGSVEKIRDQLNKGEPCILIGTQMVAKGHDFPNLTLTVVLNCDNGLHSQDFRAKETMIQNLIQVSGRSGRGTKHGQVIIQTNYPDHPTLKHLKNQDYQAFVKEELIHRKALDLPPYAYQATIRMQSLMDNTAYEKLQTVEQQLKHSSQSQLHHDLIISYAMPASIEKKSNWYRYLIVLSSPSRKRLHQYLSFSQELLAKHRRTKKLKWVIDVDPLDTL